LVQQQKPACSGFCYQKESCLRTLDGACGPLLP
jgi:hypothetical protein